MSLGFTVTLPAWITTRLESANREHKYISHTLCSICMANNCHFFPYNCLVSNFMNNPVTNRNNVKIAFIMTICFHNTMNSYFIYSYMHLFFSCVEKCFIYDNKEINILCKWLLLVCMVLFSCSLAMACNPCVGNLYFFFCLSCFLGVTLVWAILSVKILLYICVNV